jgi:hypothetical protein
MPRLLNVAVSAGTSGQDQVDLQETESTQLLDVMLRCCEIFVKKSRALRPLVLGISPLNLQYFYFRFGTDNRVSS